MREAKRHVVELSFQTWIPMAQGRIILNWRREYQIESVKMAPKVDAALFHEVVVPVGTKVQVSDEEGNHVGDIEQPQDEVASITPARFRELSDQARARREKEQQARRRRGVR